MFIPLGFGNFPRRFPILTLALAVLITVISFKAFPLIKSVDSGLKPLLVSNNIELNKLKNETMAETCGIIFPGDPYCKELTAKEVVKVKGKKKSSQVKKRPTASLKHIDFILQFRPSVENWPEAAKGLNSYHRYVEKQRAFRAETSSFYRGFASSEDISFSSFMVSTLTHVGLSHLFGNLLFLLLLGLWVEQKIGAMKLLALFFVGSFAGFLTQVLSIEFTPVIGASAGVYAIMGAFFVFFYRTQISFLFTTFFYMKRVYLPAMWTFPFMFFLPDIIEMGSLSQEGTAHHAHVGGLVIGTLFGLWIRKKENLKAGQLFHEEAPLSKSIKEGRGIKEVWRSFHEVMKWNSQNIPALKTFLMRTKAVGHRFGEHHVNFIERHLTFNLNLIMKNEEVPNLLEWMKLIPDYLDMNNCLRDIPVTQILHLADVSAQREEWPVSLRLYETALQRKLSTGARNSVQLAISEIHRINEESQYDSSSEIAA